MTKEQHEKLHEDACEKLRLLKDARETWIYDGDNEKYRRAFDDNVGAREKLHNAAIDAGIEAELLRDGLPTPRSLKQCETLEHCEGLTAPETYEVLQDEPSDELMARLKAIVKRELK